MTIATTSSLGPVGCRLRSLDPAECLRYLAWLLGEDGASAPDKASELTWTLAHCDDGVTWGRNDAKEGAWRLGSQVLSEVSPLIRQESLQELRIFGESHEVLIWRGDDGLQGRVLLECDPPADRNDESNPIRPTGEQRILRGTRVIADCAPDFTHVGDGTGAEQVLPIIVTTDNLKKGQLFLAARHYFEADPETGAVRIAATRLVNLEVRAR